MDLAASIVLVPAVAVALSTRQPARYEAQAQVLLTYQSFAGLATSVQDRSVAQSADRTAATQADLARVPTVLNLALAGVPGAGLTHQSSCIASSVAAASGADLLTFSVTASTPVVAARLATAYARAYTTYRHRLDTVSLQRARTDVGRRIAELRDSGQAEIRAGEQLLETQQQLQTLETLQTSNATVVKTAGRAVQVSPRPLRDGALGFALGLSSASASRLLVDALDTRVRSGEEVAERLGIPLLGRLPEPPKKLRERHSLVMLTRSVWSPCRGLPNAAYEPRAREHRAGGEGDRGRKRVARRGQINHYRQSCVAVARAGHRVALVDLTCGSQCWRNSSTPERATG